MTKAQDKTPLIVGAAALAVVGAVVLFKKKNSSAAYPGTDIIPIDTPVATQPATSTPTVTLNKNLLLKNGSKGNEVAELQKLLVITADGIFGPQTEAALFAKKGVKQMTLNQFAAAPNMNNAALKVGDRVMANKKPVKATKAIPLATGGYADSGANYGTFEYGKEIGKIVGVSAPTKTAYAVETTGIFSDLVWIYAGDVVKI